MMLLLRLVGVLAAAWMWVNVHPLAAVAVGILFVGGAGWLLLGDAAAAVRDLRTARAAHGPEGREFLQAWERTVAVMQPDRPETQPPRGTFPAWLRAHRATGVDAESWLAARIEGPARPECYEERKRRIG